MANSFHCGVCGTTTQDLSHPCFIRKSGEFSGATHLVLGTCSICGGAVAVPKVWMGILPPTPRCSGCGAKPKGAHGPTIEMVPS